MFSALLGIVFLVAGVCFIALPLDKLRSAFPNMRSKAVTVVCGVVLVLCGLLMLALQFL